MDGTFALTVIDDPEGGWTVLGGVPGGGHRAVAIPAEEAHAAQAAAAHLAGDDPSEVGLFVRTDAECGEQERVLGEALGGWLRQDAGLYGDLMVARSHTDEGDPLVVGVQAEGPASALDWELLAPEAGMPSWEALGAAAVVRLRRGARTEGEGRPWPGWTTSVWAPDDDDPAVRAYLDGLSAASRAVGLGGACPRDHAATVLHLVVHGTQRAGALVLALADGDQAPDTPLHGLLERVRRAELVVLGICEAGLRGEALVDTLLAAGAGAVVAHPDRLVPEVAAAFHEGLYAALAEGRSVAVAVAEGRRRVRALAHPRPEGRWHRLRLFTGRLERVVQSREPRGVLAWLPSAREGAAEAREALSEAWALARDLGMGFVGVEHLAVVMPRWVPIPLSQRVRRDDLVSRYRRLQVVSTERLGQPRPTPRLQRVVASMPAGFDVVSLWEAAARDGTPLWSLLWGHGAWAIDAAQGPDRTVPDPFDTALEEVRTVGEADAPGRTSPPGALEVVGGPEDGRRIPWTPGHRIGRWTPEGRSEVGLFARCEVVDRRLSRVALRLEEDGRIRRPDGTDPERLRARRLLKLTAAVALRPVWHPVPREAEEG